MFGQPDQKFPPDLTESGYFCGFSSSADVRKSSSPANIAMHFMVRVRTRDPRRQQQGAGGSPGTELATIRYCISGPIQARGRCPRSFEEYDPTNVDYKRRKPNNPSNNKLRKGLLASKYDSKTRIIVYRSRGFEAKSVKISEN